MTIEMTFTTPSSGEEEPTHHVIQIHPTDAAPQDPAWNGGEPPKPTPGSYVYSGRHDHGVLLPPRGTSSPMAHLVTALQHAKDASNEYLTAVMEKKSAAEQSPTNTAEPWSKRTRVEHDKQS